MKKSPRQFADHKLLFHGREACASLVLAFGVYIALLIK